MFDRDVVLLDHALGDQRAVAGFGVALDTEQRCGPSLGSADTIGVRSALSRTSVV